MIDYLCCRFGSERYAAALLLYLCRFLRVIGIDRNFEYPPDLEDLSLLDMVEYPHLFDRGMVAVCYRIESLSAFDRMIDYLCCRPARYRYQGKGA